MHPTSELILRFSRSEPRSRQSTVLLFNPPRDSLAIELQRSVGVEVSVFTQDFGDQRYFEAAGIDSSFGVVLQIETQEQTREQSQPHTLPATVILFLPREKERLEFLLHFVAAHLPAEGKLWLVGENKAGIKSANSRLKQRFSKVQKSDAARHCVLYLAREPKTWESAANSECPNKQKQLLDKADNSTGTGEHAQLSEATAAAPTEACNQGGLLKAAGDLTGGSEGQQAPEIKLFSPDDYLQEWTLPTQAGEIRLQSLPGSFARGRLDKGTALLLDYLQNADSRQLKIKGKVLDFGCGSGVIGLYLKRQYPNIDLELLDTSAVALESARLSLQLNGCEAQLTASDGLNEAKGRYDWIISNPPFHKGVATDLDIARQFIRNAPAKLGNRGRMLLVCNRHLPYEAWLAESFVGSEKVTENREFKVLQAHGPRRVK